MCELLGMSANVPTDICFSFAGLMQRGGRTGPHRDGWGIAFYEGAACRTFHDPRASAESEIAQLIHQHPIKSCTVVSHIRQATHGRVCLANTHPFLREMWGRTWAFAHNGKLAGIKKRALEFYAPVGTTDSEHAFCWMLDQLRHGPRPRTPRTLFRRVHALATTLRGHGTFNLLLSDSRYLYVYCSTKLCFITRRAPFGVARLIDLDVTIDFHRETTPQDVVSIIATRPLTDNETWTTMSPGELSVFERGEVVARFGAADARGDLP